MNTEGSSEQELFLPVLFVQNEIEVARTSNEPSLCLLSGVVNTFRVSR